MGPSCRGHHARDSRAGRPRHSCPSTKKLRQYRRMGTLVGKDFVSCFGYEDVVFDSDAELAGDVYAGFDCDDLAGLEFAFPIRLEEWVFVNLKAEAVSRAVAVNGQASFINHLSSGGVHLCDFHADLYHFYRRGLGLLHHTIDLFVKSRHATDHETSGNVAAIAFVFGAEVDKDSVFFPELSFAGLMMRPGAVRAESDYSLETVTRP